MSDGPSRASWDRLGLVLLAGWLGAALFFSAVLAPRAFGVLPSRADAASVVGSTLPAVLIAGMLIAGLTVAIWSRARAGWVMTAGAGSIALATAVAQFVVNPRIARLLAAIGGAVDALPVGDPRRASFARLHLYSVLLLGTAMLAAVVTLGAGVRGRRQPRANASLPAGDAERWSTRAQQRSRAKTTGTDTPGGVA